MKDEVISSFQLKAELDSSKNFQLEKIYSNIPTLDKVIDGFVPGELIIISGPTKHGKTTLAQSFTAEFVKQNYFPLWFSFEMPPNQFLNSFPELPMFYLPRRLKANAMEWLVIKIEESFVKFNTRIIFIDHLHFLFDLAKTRNASLDIGTIVRQLKTLAVLRNYVIFLLCHTKMGTSALKELSYESIRDSSFVSQESDCVLMIKRDIKEPESCKAKLRVEFHRRTGVLNKTVDLVKVGGYLREMEIIKPVVLQSEIKSYNQEIEF